jgi:arylsulfatase A-like enzyme
MVLNIDLAPTLLDLAGIKVPEVMDGESLVPIIKGEKTEWRKHFFFEHYVSPSPYYYIRYIPRNVGVRTENAKYIKWVDFEPFPEEYFDLTSDPVEANNLINNKDYIDMIDANKLLFEDWRRKNPIDFDYDPYGKRPHFGAKEIDWERFKEVRPKEYEKIKTEIERMGVTWEVALNDWEIRYEISMNTGYWY